MVPAASGSVTRFLPAPEEEEVRPAGADAWLGSAVRSPSHVWPALPGLPRRALPAAASTHRWLARPFPGPRSGDQGAERGHSAQSGNYFVPGHYRHLPRSGCRQNGELGPISLGARGGGLHWVDSTPRAGGNPSPESSPLRCSPNIYNCVLRTLETRSPWGLAGGDSSLSCCRTSLFIVMSPISRRCLAHSVMGGC